MLNKLRNKLKIKAEQKAADIILNHIKNEVMKSNSSWKTTIAGLITGAIPIINALIEAYQQGAFTGKQGTQLAIGVGIVIVGYLSKDKDKTGLPQA